MWGDHYETLLNCVKSDECKGNIIDFLSSDNNIKNVFIQACQIKEALKSAKLGQACGQDALAAEHFIFADQLNFNLCRRVASDPWRQPW